jgi:fructose-1-phosphate kinase PfkB-like protein
LRDALPRLLDSAARAGVAVALDSHGPALRKALASATIPALLKVNRAEAAELLELPADTPLLELARGLRAHSNGIVVVTDGIGGAIGIDADGSALHTSIPDAAGAFPVGSGDSFLGALVVALDANRSFEFALRQATAAANANAAVAGAARFDVARVAELHRAARIIPIHQR